MVQKRRHRKHNNDTQNENFGCSCGLNTSMEVDTSEETPDVNIDQLIVYPTENTYSSPTINVNTGEHKKENFTNTKNTSSQGSLFRNCAMAIAGKKTVEPAQQIVTKQDDTNSQVPPVETFDSLIQEAQHSQFTEAEQFMQTMDQEPTQQEQAVVTTNSSDSCTEEFNNEPQYIHLGHQCGHSHIGNSCGEVVCSNPDFVHMRPFNRKAFRVAYIIIVLFFIGLFAAAIVIEGIKKHKNKCESVLETDDKKPLPPPKVENTKVPEETKNVSEDIAVESVESVKSIETDQEDDTLNPYNMTGGDKFHEDLYSAIADIKRERARDERGRFVKQSDNVL